MTRGSVTVDDLLAAPGGVLDPQGPAARAAADLWWLMLILGIVVFVVFAVLLGAGLRTRPEREDGRDDEEPRLVRRWIVAGGVVMPLVVIAVVFAATLIAMEDTPTTAAADALTIEVVGNQWWYEVRYPDAGVVTANELHLPVGEPVALKLLSNDVIHSFWVPAFGGKMDLIPDRENTLVIQADEPGEHVSRCAEFCGLQHANMELAVVAEPAEAFTDWLEGKRTASGTGDAEAARGREVFLQADCVRCHVPPDGTDAAGGDGTPAPDLAGVADRGTLGAGVLANSRDAAADWITDPEAIKPGTLMPATELSRERLDALLAYLGYR